MHKILASSILTALIMVMSVWLVPASAYHILDSGMVHAMVTNPVSVFGKTYYVHMDNKTYPIYYGFHEISATVSDVIPVSERGSILLSLENVTDTDAMWIYVPQSIISADNNSFLLYADGNNTKYELATYSHATILGFMVPMGAHHVEIKGTHVIPEFQISPCIMTVGFTILLILVPVFFMKNKIKYGR